MRTEDLLTQSQSLAQELQSRQQELQQTNQELEEKAGLLAHQNQEVERKNMEVEQARQALEEKAEQLALTSKYKSEFLANMSHELRTPLNSLLILSDQLCKNPAGNLTPKQVEFAKTIHASGNDLLTLINDILDLSKIESGTVVMDPSDVRLDELQRYVERTFRHVAEAKGVDFFLRVDPRLPPAMFADLKRLQQVLKNLLSNAFKFTHQGSVTLTIDPVTSGWDPQNETLNRASEVIAISVRDTGIGISPDKQQIIFEAFQQADGSTSRKYGGTGLGLAISRELSRLLGGEIRLVSAPRSGSTFTLFLPVTYTPPRSLRKVVAERGLADAGTRATATAASNAAPAARIVEVPPMPDLRNGSSAPEAVDEPESETANDVGDDRHAIASGDRVILIVENDLAFAQLLLDAAREKGFKGIVTSSGVSALALAGEYMPSAVTLDIFLPDIDGWRVLDRLKNDDLTRHIPVTVISTDESRERALKSGAFQFAAKPMQSKEVVDALLDRLVAYLQRSRRHLLAVSSDATKRAWFEQSLAANDVKVTAVDGYEAAVAIMHREPVDCVVFDGALAPPPDGFYLHEGNGSAAPDGPPILLYGEGKDVTRVRPLGRVRQARRRARSALAGAAARAGELLPASRPGVDARRAPRGAQGSARRQRSAARQESDDRRRRHAQHLRADVAARGSRHGDRFARQRPRCRHGVARAAGRRGDPDGHHDAGDGRHRHDPRDPADSRVPRYADHRRDGQGDERRPREVHGSRCVGLSVQAGRHRADAGMPARMAVALIDER